MASKNKPLLMSLGLCAAYLLGVLKSPQEMGEPHSCTLDAVPPMQGQGAGYSLLGGLQKHTALSPWKIYLPGDTSRWYLKFPLLKKSHL